jgi:capsular exopolysaccharide synthesis family protein
VERPSVPQTFEQLREQSKYPGWHPDARTVIFASGKDHALGSEEMRTLRSRLYKIREQQALQRVLISSALPGEGKTFISANLAMTLARQSEKRVLLIDADLRKSRLHVVLGAPSAPGLSDYLNGKSEEAAVIQRGPQDNLFFIPGGNTCSNAAELITSARLKQLLQRMSGLFDWIVVDSPPTVPVSDASVLAELCDGVLLVVQACSTPYDLAQKACQQFREKHLLGAILNRAEAGSGYHSYYYNYGYGYGYGYGAEKTK